MAAVRAFLSTLHGLAHPRSAIRARPVPEPVSDPWEGAYAHAGAEPLLDDLLRDPLVLQVMHADHLELTQVRRMLGVRPRPVAL